MDLNKYKIVNDYRLFGVIKEALDTTWKTRRDIQIEVVSGLTLNSTGTTTGELAWNEPNVSIAIQIKRRFGKLIYTFEESCKRGGNSASSIAFDAIEETKFYSKMKSLAISFAKNCPSKNK